MTVIKTYEEETKSDNQKECKRKEGDIKAKVSGNPYKQIFKNLRWKKN